MEKSKTSSGKRKKKESSSAEGLAEAPGPSIHVLLQVHLWTEHGADAPQSVREMVVDLLSATPCEVRDDPSSPVMASFMEPALAVKAAWRLRRLVQGFSQASKTGRVGGCFILSSLEDARFELEVPLVQRFPVLTRGHSGHVLLVGSLCESVRAIPGLRFEAVSDEWMTPEAIRLYRVVLQLSVPVQMEGYVEEPIECWAPAIESTPQVAEVEKTAVPAAVAEAPAMGQILEVAAPFAAEPGEPGDRGILPRTRFREAHLAATLDRGGLCSGCGAGSDRGPSLKLTETGGSDCSIAGAGAAGTGFARGCADESGSLAQSCRYRD